MAIYTLLQRLFSISTISFSQNLRNSFEILCSFYYYLLKISFFSNSSQASIITSSSIPKCALCVPSAANIPCHILKHDHTYVPEPLNEEEKRDIWYSQVLIPYSIIGNTYAFMGPLPKHNKKPRIWEHFFPCFPSYEPLVFINDPFDLNFMKTVCFSHIPQLTTPHTSSGWIWSNKRRKSVIMFLRGQISKTMS